MHIPREREMKKRVGGMVFALVALLLCSCGGLFSQSDLGVYDETVPKDRLATLVIPYFYTVTRFDGKPVEWNGSGSGVLGAVIQISAGRHEVEYRYFQPQSGGGCSTETSRDCVRGICRIVTSRVCPPYIPAQTFDRKAGVTIEAGKIYTVYEQGIR
jgi:hypothetical protein